MSMGRVERHWAGEFPGGPVVKNPPSYSGDTGSIPGQGTKIPHAESPSTATKTRRSQINT